MVSKVLFSSFKDQWNTPKHIYEQLDKEFHFNYDPCPSSSTFRDFDGLGVWKERNFINPPFSEVARWIKHGYGESQCGKLCVFLVASRTDTAWFHDYVLPFAKEIRFIRGRLYFTQINQKWHEVKRNMRAPFPSCIIVFDGRKLEVS